jgi:hypothetical protein
MDARFIYAIVFGCLFLFAVWMQKKFCIICDSSTTQPKSYSYARLQLLWWTFIVLATFITILIASGKIPTLDTSTLLLLSIGALTTASARMVDLSDEANQAKKMAMLPPATPAADPAQAGNPTPSIAPVPAVVVLPLSKDMKSEGFWLDILSDRNGISIHRLQVVVFNILFGAWFIYQSLIQLKGTGPMTPINTLSSIMPVITENNLILLGLSAGTYVAMKTTENK